MNTLKTIIPKIGLRNLKTAIAIVIIYLLYSYPLKPFATEPFLGFYASTGVIFAMQSTIKSSYKSGFQRIIGTVIGGLIAIGLFSLSNHYPIPVALTLGLSIVFSIAILNKLNLNPSISTSLIVICATFFFNSENYILVTLTRIVETAFGVLVAILVNQLIFPPSSKDQKEN